MPFLQKSLPFCRCVYDSKWLTPGISQDCCLLKSKPDCHLPFFAAEAMSAALADKERTEKNVGDVPSLLQQCLLSPVKGLHRWICRTSGEDVVCWKHKLLECLCVTDQHHNSAQEKFLSVFHSWKRWLRAAWSYSLFPFLHYLPISN